MKQAQVLNDRDIQRVLAAIAKRRYAERDRAIFMLSLLTGMRAGEIAALRVENVIDKEGQVRDQIQLTAAQTKGSEARTVLLNTQAQAELARYINRIARRGAEPLFVSNAGLQFTANSLVQVFGRIYRNCGLDAATSHSGRRTFLTCLAHKGVGVRVLAALAGHKNISTTQKYLDTNANILRAAVELL